MSVFGRDVVQDISLLFRIGELFIVIRRQVFFLRVKVIWEDLSLLIFHFLNQDCSLFIWC